MGKVDMMAAEIQRYVADTHDTECTVAQYLEEMQINEALAQVYKAGKWRGPPPAISPDTPETREWIRQAAAQFESKRVGAEFMRRLAFTKP
jgi:hypothetical protein